MDFFKGFVYAGKGIAHAAATERNFRIHLCTAAFVTYFAARFYELSRAEWAVLMMAFAAVICAELFNTSIERLADKVSPEKDEHIRHCKDCAAGAVLAAAFFAVVTGFALFMDFRRFAAIAAYFSSAWYRMAGLALAVLASAAVVFLPKRR